MKHTLFTLEIPGELTDLNTYINAERRNRFMGAKIKKEMTELCTHVAQLSNIPPIQEKCSFIFQWYVKNQRKDPDNISFTKKFILDGLQKAGVLQGDSMAWVGNFCDMFFLDKENPRIIVQAYILSESSD